MRVFAQNPKINTTNRNRTLVVVVLVFFVFVFFAKHATKNAIKCMQTTLLSVSVSGVDKVE